MSTPEVVSILVVFSVETLSPLNETDVTPLSTVKTVGVATVANCTVVPSPTMGANVVGMSYSFCLFGLLAIVVLEILLP